MMKALSLWQPWATLIAIGAKEWETRSWSTDYRGPLLIHAAKNKSELEQGLAYPFSNALALGGYEVPWDLPLGEVVAICDLVTVGKVELVRSELREWEQVFGDYGDGRFAWRLVNVRRIHSPPVRGAQGLFDIDPATWPDLAATGILQQGRLF